MVWAIKSPITGESGWQSSPTFPLGGVGRMKTKVLGGRIIDFSCGYETLAL